MSRVAFAIYLLTPLCIGSGVPSYAADETVQRDATGRPVVPESVVKGSARDAGVRAGLDPSQLELAFGSAARQGLVRFTAARCAEDLTPEITVLTSPALTPSRTVRPGHLVSAEVVLPLARDRNRDLVPVTFHGSVSLRNDVDPPGDPGLPGGTSAADAALAVAVVALAAVREMGARTRRGWGQLRVGIEPSGAERVFAALGTLGPASS